MVRTASGAIAVQIADGVRRIVEHLCSAHDEAKLAALVQAGREKIAAGSGQRSLYLESLAADSARVVAPAVVESKRSALLWEVLTGACEALGLDEAVGGDEGFRQMVLARLIEPTS